MEELISIIVPIYNVEKYLKDCVDSILNQTYKNLEIILVDDGSPDRCGEICDEYAKKDKRIKVIHKKNGGLSDARNIGIEKASGEYIAFVDSDDYIAEDFIEYLHKLARKYDAGIVQCRYSIVDKKEKNFRVLESTKECLFNNKEMINKLYGEDSVNTVVVWNKLYKRELFDTIRFPIGKIHEDEFTTYKLYWTANNKIVVANKVLYYYRNNENGITKSKFSLKRLDRIEAMEERLEFFTKNEEKELYNKTLVWYIDGLIGNYRLTKTQIKELEKEQKELLQKFRNNYNEVMHLNISKKKKAKYFVFRYFPRIFENLLKSSK